MSALLAGAEPVQSADDLAFIPVPRCRVMDTRLEGGVLVAGETRAFDVAGTLGGQGGAADCQIPFAEAMVVVIQLLAVEPAGDGRLTAWPFGGAVPPGPLVEFTAGPVGMLTAERLLALCNPARTACERDLIIQADGSDTHLVADVTGYFSPPTRYVAGAGVNGAAGTSFWVNTAAIQRRVQACPTGSFIRAVDAGGHVTCEIDDDPVYEAGFAISRSEREGYTYDGRRTTWHSFSVDTSQIQRNLWNGCYDAVIRAVDESGELTCGPAVLAGRDRLWDPCGRVSSWDSFSSMPAVAVTPEGLAGTTAPPNSYCVVDDVKIDSFSFDYCCYGHMPEYVNWIAVGPS